MNFDTDEFKIKSTTFEHHAAIQAIRSAIRSWSKRRDKLMNVKGAKPTAQVERMEARIISLEGSLVHLGGHLE